MSAHTPGPWDCLNNGEIYTADLTRVIARTEVQFPARGEGNKSARHVPGEGVINMANARLIAAAPDLLAVCERFWTLACREGDFDSETDWAAVKAAVEKARGDK